MGLEKPTVVFLCERIFQKAARNPRIERDAQEALAHCRSHVRELFVWILVEEADSTSCLLLIKEVAHLFKKEQDTDEFSKGNIRIP